MDAKSFLYSKTIWVAVVYAALITFDGPINQYIKENQNIGGYALCVIFIILRIVTTGSIKFLK